ncbi:hypothetical protein [Streptomyces sp. NPDC048172]|uniref:hypothetical protein n=1 Tax=Streptomyces sp. NPDC048172 TaxID=3365505 RepID=UPI003716415E
MPLTFWRTGWRVGVRVTKHGDREIERFEGALIRLGVTRPVPRRVRVQLRIWARHRRRAEWGRTILLFQAWVVLGVLLQLALSTFDDRQNADEGPPSSTEQLLDAVDRLPRGLAIAVLLVLLAVSLAVAFALVFIAVGMLVVPLLTLYGVPAMDTRSIHPVSRALPVLVFARAVEACAEAHRVGGERHLKARRKVGDQMQGVARTLARAHWKRGAVSMRSHRRAELKRHAGRVVAVLRRAEARLDSEPHAALRELGELLLTVAERYADGRVGALLDEEELRDVEPVRSYELVRLALAVLLIGGGGAGIALLGLPSVVQPYALSAWGLLVLLFVYGRGVRPGPGELWGGLNGAGR